MPRVRTAVKQIIRIMANITAYSTAVGPSSFVKKRNSFAYKDFIDHSPCHDTYPGKSIQHEGMATRSHICTCHAEMRLTEEDFNEHGKEIRLPKEIRRQLSPSFLVQLRIVANLRPLQIKSAHPTARTAQGASQLPILQYARHSPRTHPTGDPRPDRTLLLLLTERSGR